MIIDYFKQLSFSFLKLNNTDSSNYVDKVTTDNNQDLKEIWDRLIDQYFDGNLELKQYRLVWSGKNQKRVLASCNIFKKVVRVAPAMKFGDAPMFIEPLLYHELCHAVVGYITVGRKRVFHSKQFRIQESRHPQIKLMNEWIKLGGWNKSVLLSRRKLRHLRNHR